MVLSDATIARYLAEGKIEIDPYDESLLQPSSVDVRVDRLFRVFHNNRYPFIDVKAEQAELTELVEVDDEHPFILHPGEFVLGSTLERIKLPDDLVARLEGKSSLGRLGLLIHSTAGFIDPGWDGHVTLELSNVANLPITIYPGMKIGQISFMQMTEPAAKPYGSTRSARSTRASRGRPEQILEELRVTVLLTGGTGFIGPHVAHALRARDEHVRALVRNPSRATRLTAWGVELAAGGVNDATSLRDACEGVDTVVHLVSIIKGSPADFERVMAQGTRNLVAAAQDAGVRRFVLASALGLDETTKDATPYYAAKWEMAARGARSPASTTSSSGRASSSAATAACCRRSSASPASRRSRRSSGRERRSSSRSGSRISRSTSRTRSRSRSPGRSSSAGRTR